MCHTSPMVRQIQTTTKSSRWIASSPLACQGGFYFFIFSYFLPKSEVDVPYGRAMQLVMTALKWFVSSPSDDFNECERRILTLQHSEVAVITAAITADTEQGQSAACSYCAAEQKEGSSLSST